MGKEHRRTWIIARELKNFEMETLTVEILEYGEKTEK
jgi:hypothetical protein